MSEVLFTIGTSFVILGALVLVVRSMCKEVAEGGN